MQSKILKTSTVFFWLLTFCINLNAQVKTKVFYSNIPIFYKLALKEIPNIYTVEPSTKFTKLNASKKDVGDLKFATTPRFVAHETTKQKPVKKILPHCLKKV